MLGRPSDIRGRMVDIDLLPQVYVPRQRIPLDIERVSWLLSLLMVLLLGPQLLGIRNISAELGSLKTSVAEAEVRSKIFIVPREVKELQDRLDSTQKQLAGAEKASMEVLNIQLPWVTLMRPVSDLKPAGVSLGSFTQKEAGIITVEGRADSEPAIVTYAGRLRMSNLFSEVVIQSITAQEFIRFTLVLTLKAL